MGDENLPHGITREEVERHKSIQRFLALDPDEEEHRKKYGGQGDQGDESGLMGMFQEALRQGMEEESREQTRRERRGGSRRG